MIPVQIADGHQCKRWAAGSLCSLIYFLAFTGEGVEVDNRGFWFGAWKNGCGFAAYYEGSDTGSPAFYIGNYYTLKAKEFSALCCKETVCTPA